MREQRFCNGSAWSAAFAMLLLSLSGCGTSVVLPLGPGNGPSTLGGAVTQTPYCAPVADWDEEWAAFEVAVLQLVNEQRANGADCGGTAYPPAGPLAMNGALRCAARKHSLDMGTRDYFSHSSPDGTGPGERLNQADYHASTWGENIAWGYGSPEAVVAGWMGSPGHCANIMNANFSETGIGYFEGALWTQTFGRP